MTRPLVVFDIDGTLTDTNGIDGECYQLAMQALFGIANISTDWGAYQYSTDAGIIEEVFRTHRKEEISADDILRFKQHFVGLMRKRQEVQPECVQPIAGALEILSYLQENGFDVGIATGAWQVSAEFKLRGAKIPYEKLTLSHSDHAKDRADIIRRTIQELGAPSRVIYVGDGLWDMKAARTLNIGFIALDSANRAEAFRAAGVSEIFSNYLERERFLEVCKNLA